VEYNMMSKLKYRLIDSSSSLVVAFVLLAFSLALGSSRSYAQDVDAISCPPPALDIVAELAEELDVACHSYVAAEASSPVAIEGQAIRVEITQSVTVAALGESVENVEGLEVTGSVESIGVANE
jgi:hypothetical protein